MNKIGEADGRLLSHIGLWIFAIGIVIFLTWSAVNKKSEDNTFRSGSVDNSKVINVYPLGMAPGCEYIKQDGSPLKPGEKGSKK